MDHPEAREILEAAAVEPGGLDRLMAGDTREAAALAGHLAGCDECTRLMARLRRDVAVIAGVVRTTPPPGLRDRTLAYVRSVGRERGSDGAAAAVGVGVAGGMSSRTEGTRRGWRLPRAAMAAGLAAVLIAAVVGTAALVDARNRDVIAARDAELARQSEIVAALSRVTTWTLRVGAEPDARRVALAGPGSGSGTILFSPASHELVVVATGLTEPASGELQCWVSVDGRRERVGRMFFGGDLAYWAGPVEALDAIRPGAEFGVSPVDASGEPVADPVLSGRLGEG
ncbi:MAG TPA: anti-sigma factor [Candidatus Limnocylindrales bacterium]|jgi:hypothetical protein